MGGYHRYDGDTPVYPLHWEDVVELVRHGDIVLPGTPVALINPNTTSGPSTPTVSPTMDEIKGRSKGDAFSKGFALLQTTWFVVQCIARAILHLPITELEIVTLAYTAITVLMYCFWWYKPLSVVVPVRVRVSDGFRPYTNETGDPKSLQFTEGIIERLALAFRVVYGAPISDNTGVSGRKQVPTFYSAIKDVQDDDLYYISSLISSMTYIMFGAIHCIAWSFSFPTATEQELWQISSSTLR